MNALINFEARENATKSSQIDPRHWENMIQARGLSPEWIAANARSVTAEEATELLGYKAKSTGIWLEGAKYQGQFKPDKPWRSDDEPNKKAPKYRSPAGSDYDVVLPAHPENPSYWDDLDDLKEMAYKVNGHPCLLITEGVFTAIAPSAAGIPTVGLLGVSMGLTSSKQDPQGKRYLVPELERLARAGLGFIIGFDADAATKKEVGWEQLKLANQLKLFDVPVYSITGGWTVEEGKGIDDYMQLNGNDRFIREVMGKAVDISVWERQFKSYSQETGERPPSARRTGLEIADKYKDKWAFHNEQKTWRVFDGKTWQAEEDEAFGQIVFTIVEAQGIEYSTHRYIENVTKTIRCKLLVKKWQEWDRKRYIPFANGVLNIETGELMKHSPGFRFTSCLDWDYSALDLSNASVIDALAKHCPHTHRFMNASMSGDNKRVEKMLAAINAMVKWRWAIDFQMFLHLQGDPGTGKGTFARLLQKIAGKENSKGSNSRKLDDGNELGAIIDKQLVILPDERKPSKDIGPILSLTGGDPISYREIYKKAASATFGGLLLISSNKPIFAGDFVGIDRRHCLIHFNTRVSDAQRNPKIEELMEKEIGALIPIALSMSDARVTELIRGFGGGDISAFRKQLWELKTEENSVAQWIQERLVYDPNIYTRIGNGGESNTLYADYLQFVENTKSKAVSLKSFSPTIQELCYGHLSHFGWTDVKKSRLTTGVHKGKPVMHCLRLRKPEDEQPFLDKAEIEPQPKQPSFELPYDRLNDEERSRFDEAIAITTKLMGQLQWNQEQGRNYLRHRYKVASRHSLTLDLLLEFQTHLLQEAQHLSSEPIAESTLTVDWSTFPYVKVEYFGKNIKRETQYKAQACENKAREIRNAIIKNRGIKGLDVRFDSAQIAWVLEHFSNEELQVAISNEKYQQTSLDLGL